MSAAGKCAWVSKKQGGSRPALPTHPFGIHTNDTLIRQVLLGGSDALVHQVMTRGVHAAGGAASARDVKWERAGTKSAPPHPSSCFHKASRLLGFTAGQRTVSTYSIVRSEAGL